MDGHSDRRRPSPWRRLREWVDLGREDIDQQGLLAGRTLVAAPRRIARDERESDVAAARSGPNDAPR
jgi:hypothetical protein